MDPKEKQNIGGITVESTKEGGGEFDDHDTIGVTEKTK